MQKCFTFAPRGRIRVFLCYTATVFLTACGGGTAEGFEQPSQTAAQTYVDTARQSQAPIAADASSAAAASEPTGTETANGIPTATTTQPAQKCDYYIASNGSDNGAGTYASPWKTIQYASANLPAGKILCALGGTY